VLTKIVNLIWFIFVVDFLVGLIRAPSKRRYFAKNWLVAISLMIPAIRVFRIFRIIRVLRLTAVVRGLHFVRLYTSFRRSLGALGVTLQRRGFQYVFAVTVIVVFAGGAGMYAFERGARQDAFTSYAESVWWTAMLITTIGPESWPVTMAGRILCLVLSIYAIAVFGYIAATLASYFIGRDAAQTIRPADLQNLRQTLDRLSEQLDKTGKSLKDMQQDTPD
jgi:voltage-gated potassium channel